MRLFTKNYKPDDDQPTFSDKVAGKIARTGLRFQERLSNRINGLLARMSRRALKVLLTVFCLSGGGYSAYIIYTAVFGPLNSQPKIHIEPVKVPRHIDKSGDDWVHSEILVDEETYHKIQAFKNYMDSLQKHEKQSYDSIMRERPGLMDSVVMLEEIYNSQQLK
jgi:hypothetical protein